MAAADPARQAYRKEKRQEGLHGPALHHAMAAWNQGQDASNLAAAQKEEQSLGIDPNSPLAPSNPTNFIRRLNKGHLGLGEGMPTKKQIDVMRLVQQNQYGQEQKQLSDELSKALAGGSEVPGLSDTGNPTQNLANENQILGNLESFANDKLGVGLTPDQTAAYRAQMRAPFEQQYNQDVQATSGAEAAAGIDPRSGFGGAQSNRLAMERMQGLSGIENQLTAEDTAQRNVNEQFASTVAGQEEQGIQGDVNDRLRRLAQVESGMAGQEAQQESERQFDLGLLTSADQAKLSREMWARLAREEMPSTFEKVSGGISGFLGGLGA